MTDLELTRLCAEAMGIADTHFIDQSYDGDFQMWPCLQDDTDYDPLHDDAQAMALVKSFGLSVRKIDPDLWDAWIPLHSIAQGSHADLNRAICECVAYSLEEKS